MLNCNSACICRYTVRGTLVLMWKAVAAGEAFAPFGLVGSALQIRRSGVLGLAAQEGIAAQSGGEESASTGSKVAKSGVSQWGKRFASALDANPGRGERRERSEQEDRYKQVLATSPGNVDALCGYACFKSTVREDYDVAAQLYTNALRADPERARRITIQLWADLWSMKAEKSRTEEAKTAWMDLFGKVAEGKRRIPVPVPPAALHRVVALQQCAESAVAGAQDVVSAFKQANLEVPQSEIDETTVPQALRLPGPAQHAPAKHAPPS
jgi:hypothetical protein